jgi:hypothetical protein
MMANLHREWPALGPLLAPALAISRDKPNVLAEVMAHRADLWGIYEDGNAVAAVLTTKQEDGRCLLWLVGGTRMREWAPQFMAFLIEKAREAGCSAIWGAGRAGWARIVSQFGGERIEDHNGRPAWELRL